ncbi:hypothetical protein [Zoogloea dura]|uniref:Uncharacterized protein n=1 Tax=Zoogloea dura TaxID=2728840 RepID=A0A848G1T8_9RHOO|nr:hypothetical protein [Zoogloea dura]NML26157.1 hypothetical protein [Zoogloea dura]
MRKSMQEQLLALLNKNEPKTFESSNKSDFLTPRYRQANQKSLNDGSAEQDRSKGVNLAAAKPEAALSRPVFPGSNLSLRERLIAQGVIKPASNGGKTPSKKVKLSADIQSGAIRRCTTRRQDRGPVLDLNVLRKALSTRGVVDGVDYLSLVGELREDEGAESTRNVRSGPPPSKNYAAPVAAKKSENKKLDANSASKNAKASPVYRYQKRFKCFRCGKWIPLGQGLKHEAMHEGRDYIPLADVRPKSMSRIESSSIRNSRWVYVFQGGLPSLGKRSR